MRNWLHKECHTWMFSWLRDSKDEADARTILDKEHDLFIEGGRTLLEAKPAFFGSLKVNQGSA